MVNEWTLTAKGGAKAGDMRATRDGNGNRIGNWYNYTVDLSAYAGQQVHRHPSLQLQRPVHPER